MTPEKTARFGIAVGVVVLGVKYLAYTVTGSVALYSDALESIVNVVAAVGAWWALSVAEKPADHDHPWGHGKAEYFSAAVEGALIAVAAVSIIREAVPKLLAPKPMESFVLGAAISLAATALNAAWAWFLVKKGRAMHSPALVADGMHLYSDVITTAGVLVGVVAAGLTGWWILDPLLAIAVALQILVVGWRLVRDSTNALMDLSLPDEQVAALARVAGEAAGSARPEGLRARRSGPRVFVEMRLYVPASTPVGDAHATCDRIEEAVRAHTPGAEVVVHVEPEPASA